MSLNKIHKITMEFLSALQETIKKIYLEKSETEKSSYLACAEIMSLLRAASGAIGKNGAVMSDENFDMFLKQNIEILKSGSILVRDVVKKNAKENNGDENIQIDLSIFDFDDTSKH